MWIPLFHVGHRGKRHTGAGRSVRDAGQCVREQIDVFRIGLMRSGCPPLRAGHSLCGDESLWAARPQWVVDLHISRLELGTEHLWHPGRGVRQTGAMSRSAQSGSLHDQPCSHVTIGLRLLQGLTLQDTSGSPSTRLCGFPKVFVGPYRLDFTDRLCPE